VCLCNYVYLCFFSSSFSFEDHFCPSGYMSYFTTPSTLLLSPEYHIYQRKPTSSVQIQTVEVWQSSSVSCIVHVVLYRLVQANFFYRKPEIKNSLSELINYKHSYRLTCNYSDIQQWGMGHFYSHEFNFCQTTEVYNLQKSEGIFYGLIKKLLF
jgi:hypothetical protein